MTIYIPEKLRVGYDKRSEAYSGKLAYVIYYRKNKLCKEKSWENWRDKSIEPDDYPNTPLEGFVLNQKAGGWGGGWDKRNTYCRVHDPRGFEFEINMENLLYILENTNSIKGKGLEGKFVYGFDNGDTILIPEGAPEYKELIELAGLVDGKQGGLKAKDLIPGAIYLNNHGNKYIYLGRFDKYEHNWTGQQIRGSYQHKYINKGLKHWFKNLEKDYYLHTASLSGRIVKLVDPNPVYDYADIMQKLQHHREYSPPKHESTELVPITKELLEERSKWTTKEVKAVWVVDGVEVYCNLNKKDDKYSLAYLYRSIPEPGWNDTWLEMLKKKLCAEMPGFRSYSGYPSDNKPAAAIEEILAYQPLQIELKYLQNEKEDFDYGG